MDINYRPRVNLQARVLVTSDALKTFPRRIPCTCSLCSGELHCDHHRQPEYVPSQGRSVWFLRLQPHGHESISLALAIANGFQRRRGPTADQISASHAWKQLWPEFKQELHPESQTLASTRLVALAFQIFNEIFFCKKLERVDIEWEPSLPNNAIGNCGPGKMGKVYQHTLIRLIYGLHGEELVSTLLHEMTHALFQQYTCNKPDCSCRVIHGCILSKTGHGRAFMWLAAAIRDSSEALLGFGVEVYATKYLARLIRKNGCHPSLHDLQVCLPDKACPRWSLSPAQWEAFRRASETHAEHERRAWHQYNAARAPPPDLMEVDCASLEEVTGIEAPAHGEVRPAFSCMVQ